jgi:hypothetical protein
MKRWKIPIRLAAVLMAAFMLAGCGGARLSDLNAVRERANVYALNFDARIMPEELYSGGRPSQTFINNPSVGERNIPFGNLMSERSRGGDFDTFVMQNDYWIVHVGEYFDLYFLCRMTGHVMATNPVYMDYTPAERETFFSSGVGATFTDAQRILYSQLDIEYYNFAGRKFELWSFPDSVSPNRANQIMWDTGWRHYDANGLTLDDEAPTEDRARSNRTMTLTYNIGTDLAESGLMLAMSVDTFNEYESRLLRLVDEGVFDIPTIRIFINNYTKLTYEDMLAGNTDFCACCYAERYPALPELGEVYMLKPVSNRQINDLLMLYAAMEVTPEELAKELDLMGRVTMGSNPAYFRIPLVYELDGPSILKYVLTDQIVHSYGFILEKININRTFGATLSIDDGYLFIPDGSGAIIRNDEPVRAMSRMSLPFYGPDFGKLYVRSTDVPINSTLPVFGTKRNDVGMFAVAEHGSALGGINVEIAGNAILRPDGSVQQNFSGHVPYNMVFPYVVYHDFDAFSMRGVTLNRMFAQEPYRTQFTVRYNVLYDEWAEYAMWARYYQMYLERTMPPDENGRGGFTRNQSNDPLPIDINVLGSITKIVNTFGVPWAREYAVTSFDEAQSIMDTFAANGIGHANLIYSGAINGGIDFRSPNRINFQRELGGLNGFNNLHRAMENQNFNLYNEIDFGRVYQSGNGITIGISANDTSRNLQKWTAVLTEYSPANLVRTGFGQVSSLINPLIYNSVGNSFINQYNGVSSRNVFLASLGGLLSSNFHEEMEVNRMESQMLTRELLQAMRDADFNIKMDTGNAYVLDFADSLISVPTSSSGRRMESYSVPFVGMVLKGYIPFTSESINRSGNMHRMLLQAVESGAGLHYTLIYANQLALVDTHYAQLFSVNHEIWNNDIIEIYNRINNGLVYNCGVCTRNCRPLHDCEHGEWVYHRHYELGHLANVRIRNHQRLGIHGTPLENVAMVTYENGDVVYVNYGRTYYDTNNGQVYRRLAERDGGGFVNAETGAPVAESVALGNTVVKGLDYLVVRR